MHGDNKDATVPLLCCLMRNITQEKNEERFAAIKNLNLMLDPHGVTIDFETAPIEALKSNFRNAKKNCFLTLHRQFGDKFKVLDWRKNTKKNMSILQFSKLLIFCDKNKVRQRTSDLHCNLERRISKKPIIKKCPKN